MSTCFIEYVIVNLQLRCQISHSPASTKSWARWIYFEILKQNLLWQGEGTERLLVKGKKEEVMTVDGDQFRYFLLAGAKYQVDIQIHIT